MEISSKALIEYCRSKVRDDSEMNLDLRPEVA